MRDEDTELLFKTLSQILTNQNEIKKHLGINDKSAEYTWETDTEELLKECSETARSFKHESVNCW